MRVELHTRPWHGWSADSPAVASLGACNAQNNGFEDDNLDKIVDTCVAHLKRMRRLPEHFQHRSAADWKASHSVVDMPPHPVVGRQQDIQDIKAKVLSNTRLLVLWGGAGEGKTTLARTVACELFREGQLPGGAYLVDLYGEIVPAFAGHRAA